MYGAAKCRWTETEQRTQGTTIHYEGKHVYLNSVNYLFGHAGADAVELPSGTHRYNLIFQVPVLIPASFEAEHGHIRYHVEAVLDVPWGYDKECKVQFKVARNDDLNYQPELKLGSHNEEIKCFGYLCCESDPLIVTLKLPFIGFVPGQGIPYEIWYINRSDVAVRGTKISLRRIIRYNRLVSDSNFVRILVLLVAILSTSPHYKNKIEILNVTQSNESGVECGKRNKVKGILTIPSDVVNSNSSCCYVVQVSYDVFVEALTTGAHQNVELCTPIVIGTTPLIMDQNNSQAASRAIQQPPNTINVSDQLKCLIAPLVAITELRELLKSGF